MPPQKRTWEAFQSSVHQYCLLLGRTGPLSVSTPVLLCYGNFQRRSTVRDRQLTVTAKHQMPCQLGLKALMVCFILLSVSCHTMRRFNRNNALTVEVAFEAAARASWLRLRWRATSPRRHASSVTDSRRCPALSKLVDSTRKAVGFWDLMRDQQQ